MHIARQQAARFTSVALILIFYGFSRLPTLPEPERQALASQFAFSASELPTVSNFETQALRQVHPNLAHMARWISAFNGAAVALNDLDGDGLPNDICYIDPRIDQVIVGPVPQTGDRYQPFVLQADPAWYDPTRSAPVGCLPGDMNEDGLLDILVYYWGRPPTAYLRADDSGKTFTNASYVPHPILEANESWWSGAATFSDLDGDGHSDLIVANYFPDQTAVLGPDRGLPPVTMQSSMSRAFNGGDTHIFLWVGGTSGARPSVQYRPMTGILNDAIAHGWTLAVGAADLDGDLLPELYFANDYGPDRLLHNRSRPGQLEFVPLEGIKRFTTPASKVLGRDSFKGMGIDFGDLNNDGILDLFVSNIVDEFAFHESHFAFVSTGQPELMTAGIAPYIDESEPLGLSRSGWAWETRLADFNNDGRLEAVQATGFIKGQINRWPEVQELGLGNDALLAATVFWPHLNLDAEISGLDHNPFYVLDQRGRYFDLAPDLGLDRIQTTRGIATADVDGDGDLDFAIANQWDTSFFYLNECPHCADFLGLHLLLTKKIPADTIVKPGHPQAGLRARPAIGALARVHLPNGEQRTGFIDGGNGHSGARSSDLHFGLGQLPANAKLDVDLHWRNSQGQVKRETVRLSPGWHTIFLGD